MKKSHPQPAPQNPEALYAQVDKSQRSGGRRIPSEASPYDRPRGRTNEQKNSPYNTPRTGAYNTPPSQQPLGTIYAPQYPLGATHAAVGRGSREPSPENPTNPYAVVNLTSGETEFQEQRNPLYDTSRESTQDLQRSPKPEEHLYTEPDFSKNSRRSPQKPLESVYAKLGMGAEDGQEPQKPEHLYAELDFGANGGLSPHKPLESVYATVGMGAEGGQESQQRENPIYQGVGRGATPPPRTPKDVVTTKLLQSREFQHGIRVTQEWCTVVYGNAHALNEPLAQILDDPKNAERVLWDLAEHPESPAKLAGRQVLGVKSPNRRAAEDGFSPLCSALEKHIRTVQKLHKQFTREQERDQRQESPERDAEHRHHHHHHRHARGQEQNSPEHSPQRQRHGEKGVAYAI
ncbi:MULTISPECIES: BID domain-containing T4SS effector [unclassified Bartonella]|uniref:BID domain-containing T4SS effector n=1 Tax=unclassified Bartonella TaxID=2645622 RepID=UPI0035CF2092